MAAADTAAKAASGTVGLAGKTLKWGFNQLHPFGENGKLGRTLALGTTGLLACTALTTLAPPAAFAAAAKGLPAIPGIMDYAGAGMEIAWAGGDVLWNVASSVGTTVGETLPGAYADVMNEVQAAALEAN